MSTDYPLDTATEKTPETSTVRSWIERMFTRAGKLPCPFAVHTPAGDVRVGDGNPEFELFVRNDDGMRALKSIDELTIADAYVRGDLDIEGDVVKAMWLRDALFDRNLWLKIWRRVEPMIFGRTRVNPGWISKHYDLNNVQLYALDSKYGAYTPGIYERDDDGLETSVQRKYEFAWNELRLKEGDELLEVGCGWGGMTRFCARRGVKVTSLTLSKHQLEYTRKKLDAEGLDADVRYQDFFTYEPQREFDAVSCMGVMEHLSEYARTLTQFASVMKQGARLYLDFGSQKERHGGSSFITKYIWPGNFRLVYMPELMEAVDRSLLQVAGVYNDRLNYFRWSRDGYLRWMENKKKVVEEVGEEMYRLFLLFFAGTAGVMSNPNQEIGAYRMVLERP